MSLIQNNLDTSSKINLSFQTFHITTCTPQYQITIFNGHGCPLGRSQSGAEVDLSFLWGRQSDNYNLVWERGKRFANEFYPINCIAGRSYGFRYIQLPIVRSILIVTGKIQEQISYRLISHTMVCFSNDLHANQILRLFITPLKNQFPN